MHTFISLHVLKLRMHIIFKIALFKPSITMTNCRMVTITEMNLIVKICIVSAYCEARQISNEVITTFTIQTLPSIRTLALRHIFLFIRKLGFFSPHDHLRCCDSATVTSWPILSVHGIHIAIVVYFSRMRAFVLFS